MAADIRQVSKECITYTAWWVFCDNPRFPWWSSFLTRRARTFSDKLSTITMTTTMTSAKVLLRMMITSFDATFVSISRVGSLLLHVLTHHSALS